MPKKTKKYVSAINIAISSKIASAWDEITSNQESLYTLLADHEYYWDSKASQWILSSDEPADAPTPLLMIRVWSNAENTEDAADLVAHALADRFRLVERSQVYPCRPPKQKEARIYLKFEPRYLPKEFPARPL